MRATGQRMGLEVHGIFWTFDQFSLHQICDQRQIHSALVALLQDPFTRLPKNLLNQYIDKYKP